MVLQDPVPYGTCIAILQEDMIQGLILDVTQRADGVTGHAVTRHTVSRPASFSQRQPSKHLEPKRSKGISELCSTVEASFAVEEGAVGSANGEGARGSPLPAEDILTAGL